MKKISGMPRYLPRMFFVCILCGVIFLGGSGKGGGGGKNPSTGATDCKTSVKATVNLFFPRASDIPVRSPLPECQLVFPGIGGSPFSDHGSTSFNNPNQYICKIMVRAACGYSRQYFWTKPNGFFEIEVPQNVPHTVIVEYYENCTRCNPIVPGRTQLAFKQDFQVPALVIGARLNYVGYIGC